MTNNVYVVTNAGINNTTLMTNTMVLKAIDGLNLSVAEVNLAIASIRTFYDALKSFQTSTSFWTAGSKVIIKDYTTPGVPGVIMGTTPAAVVAGTGGVQTANQLAICVNWRTAIAGRRTRGRTFIGVLAATTVAGGVLAGGTVTSVTTAGNALITNLAALAHPVALHIWSRVPGAEQANPVISSGTDSVIDTLRSRKR